MCFTILRDMYPSSFVHYPLGFPDFLVLVTSIFWSSHFIILKIGKEAHRRIQARKEQNELLIEEN